VPNLLLPILLGQNAHPSNKTAPNEKWGILKRIISIPYLLGHYKHSERNTVKHYELEGKTI
jgi:hypothetical protein